MFLSSWLSSAQSNRNKCESYTGPQHQMKRQHTINHISGKECQEMWSWYLWFIWLFIRWNNYTLFKGLGSSICICKLMRVSRNQSRLYYVFMKCSYICGFYQQWTLHNLALHKVDAEGLVCELTARSYKFQHLEDASFVFVFLCN